MTTALTRGALSRALVGDELAFSRVAAVLQRSMTALGSGGSYWWLVLSGLAEPLLYLFAMGWGVGALVGDITLADGRTVPYLVFIAPALLASASMNGAVAESTMNFFSKLKFSKIYYPMLNTPVTPVEIAFGELGWAMMRGAMYTVAFLAVAVGIGLTSPLLAALAVPAALLVGLAFGAAGMTLATLMRTWQDFDYVSILLFALFLFSGTFVPVDTYPAGLQVVVWATPLFHGVELLRGVMLEQFHLGLLWHVAYLLAVTLAAMAVASRRIARMLRR
ncbi:MAG TPA: ABC transporter permease [Natronosporangium sp.]|nr:ABC transporter permease [Natronosporangium sp.]